MNATYPSNEKLLAVAAQDVIDSLANRTVTIASAIEQWNTCVAQTGFTGTYDFPTTGYTRKAQLVADLTKCIAQLSVTFNNAVPAIGNPAHPIENMWGVEINNVLVGAVWFCPRSRPVPDYQLIIKQKMIGSYPTLAEAQQAARQFLFN